MRPISITIIIPAFNEEKAIKNTIDRLKSLSKKENWISEVIVINDGSTDNTSSISKSLGVVVIDHPTNGGYGLSLQHGIKLAKHELVAITDADGTYPIEKLAELVKMVEEKGFDMAVGERQGREYRRGLWKYPARIIFKLLSEYVAGRRIPDINSGLRVMKREKLLPHYERTCYGFSFTTSITLIFFLNGYFVGYLPIAYEKRVGKSKVKHFRDSLRTAQIMVSVIAFYNPLKLFLLVSFVSLGSAILSEILGMIFDFSSLLFLSLLFIAVIPIIFSIGILAELIRIRDVK